MLECQDLPTITQRTLRQQPDLREAIHDHPFRFQPLNRFEKPLDRFTQFEIRRVQQALALFRIERTLGRQQLDDVD